MGKLYRAQEILDCLSISIKLDFYTDLFYFPYVFYIFVWWDENISQSLSSVSMMQSFRWHRFYCWISSEPITRIHLPMQETQETWVWSLGREDPLEKERVTHSSILAWEILWTKEPGGLQSMGSQRVRHDWVISLLLFAFTYSWERVCAQSCLTLFEPGDCSLPGSSVHGIIMARILEWVAIASSGDFPNPGI